MAGSKEPVFDAVQQAYPIMDDDGRMRKVIHKEPSSRAEFFDDLRQKYPRRLEFNHYLVKGAGAESERLKALGFQVK